MAWTPFLCVANFNDGLACAKSSASRKQVFLDVCIYDAGHVAAKWRFYLITFKIFHLLGAVLIPDLNLEVTGQKLQISPNQNYSWTQFIFEVMLWLSLNILTNRR